jgi:hypothetical protein
MKAEFLKIAGVKSDKAFYKKYPTEAAFFKAHPEAKKSVKKAQYGVVAGVSNYLQSMNNVPNMQNMMQGQMQSPGVNAGMFSGSQVDNSVSTINASQLADDKSGYAFAGGPNTNVDKLNNLGSQLSTYAPMAGQLISGYQNLRAGRRARKEAEMWAKVTGLQAQAAESVDVDDPRQYTENAERRRRAFMPEMTGEEFFPVYGVGTNVLGRNGARLQDGGMIGGNPTEIQNTYGNGNSLYDNLEYEPLYDVDQVKSYKMGGYLPKAFAGAEMFEPSSMMSSMGGGGTPWGAIGGIGSGIAGNLTGNDGGGQIGGALGGAAGMALGGPMGAAIGSTLGTAVGGLLDTNDRDRKKAEQTTKWNTNRMIASQYRESLQQGPFGSYMRNGGYMNPEYNPQVITMFGDVNAQDFADYAHKDQFRAGGNIKGNYKQPSARALSTMEEGGELQTHWGGHAELMSYNPYMPGSGETVLFRGQSHNDSDREGNTGIGITYGDNPVEVERGEPMFEMQSGGQVNPETGKPENTGVVFGNMQINKKVAGEINDPDLMKIANMYDGKKFKNVGIDLSKQEVKQNKIISKNTDILDSFKVESSIDKAKLAALQANIEGAKSNLKNIANTKIILANFQNSINEAKEEMSENFGENISAEDLAKGYVKLDKDPVTMNAKWGGDIIKKAKDGDKPRSFKSDREAAAAGYRKGADGKYYRKIKKFSTKDTETKSASAMDYIPKQSADKSTGLYGDITPAQFEEYKNKNKWFNWTGFDPKNPDDVDRYAKAFNAEAEKRGSKARMLPDDATTGKTKYVGKQFMSSTLEEAKKTEPAITEEELTATVEEPEYAPMEEEKSKFPWLPLISQGLRFFTPTDQQALSPRQLMGEMYAMSTNQLEPVQATPYSPELRIPYDISRQAAKNDLLAQTRAAQRMAQGNPAAQAYIAGQAYNPMQQLNEQDFIDNQRMKDAVYSGNIQTLNDAELRNLEIYDRQYQRQAQALSNTKATSQAAISSISDKYAKNALENRKLSIYENMYPNFRFGLDGRAQNYGLHLFDTTVGGGKSSSKGGLAEGKEFTYDANGNIVGVRAGDKDSRNDDIDEIEAIGKNKNGGSHKKNYKNSSVVRAYKNL